MKHTHITILKEDLERFKTACEINQGTTLINYTDGIGKDTIGLFLQYTIEADLFYLGAKFERNENG